MQLNDSRENELQKQVYIHKTCRSIVDYKENVHYIMPFEWNGSNYVRKGYVDSYCYPEENFYYCPKCDDHVDDIEEISYFNAK